MRGLVKALAITVTVVATTTACVHDEYYSEGHGLHWRCNHGDYYACEALRQDHAQQQMMWRSPPAPALAPPPPERHHHRHHQDENGWRGNYSRSGWH